MQKEVLIKATMDEKWIPYFECFLKQMEAAASKGHPCSVAMTIDKEFHPEFKFNKVIMDDDIIWVSNDHIVSTMNLVENRRTKTSATK